IAGKRHREAAVEQRDGRRQLLGLADACERAVDQLARDAAPSEIVGDPLTPPLVELAPVGGEALRVGGVVDESDRSHLIDRSVDRLRVEAAPAEKDAQLVLGAVAARGGSVCELDRAPLLRRIAQAALRSSSASPAASMITPS